MASETTIPRTSQQAPHAPGARRRGAAIDYSPRVVEVQHPPSLPLGKQRGRLLVPEKFKSRIKRFVLRSAVTSASTPAYDARGVEAAGIGGHTPAEDNTINTVPPMSGRAGWGYAAGGRALREGTRVHEYDNVQLLQKLQFTAALIE